LNPPVLNSPTHLSILPETTVSSFKNKVQEIFDRLSYPVSSDEPWRKFPLHQMDFPSLVQQVVSQSIVSSVESHEPSEREIKNADVILAGLLTQSKENYFALYTLLHASKYYFFELNENADVDHLYDWSCKINSDQNGYAVFLVYLKSNASAKIHEVYSSIASSDKIHMLGSVSYYHLEDNSQLDVLVEEDYDENLFHFRFVSSSQDNDSRLTYQSFPTGGFRGKHFYHPILNGRGCNLLLTGVSSLRNRELLDIEAKVSHMASNTTSKISYKAIVNDRSHHIFTGNLAIPSSVKKVSAHQESHNLSLNKKARAEANPKLEVMSEDVSCTHGATVGDIDEEQLFYLLSRGLTSEESKSLLVSAFYEETIAKIPFPDNIKAALSEKIRKTFLETNSGI
jgi:Fe-S cluster assembly protein SufD